MNKIAEIGARHEIDWFENNFEEYINNIATVINMGSPSSARPVVQALVNAYHLVGTGVGADRTKNFSTLMMLVKITGASLDPVKVK